MNPTDEPRRTFSITLDEYDADMLHRAALAMHNNELWDAETNATS